MEIVLMVCITAVIGAGAVAVLTYLIDKNANRNDRLGND